VESLAVVQTWPVDTASVAVIDRTGVVASTGPDGPLPWASVTKLLTALTALDAVHRGQLSLDDHAGPPGSTVRHLLAHASGLAPDDDAPLSAPGRRRIYSNSGFERLADAVTERSGRPFAEHMDTAVLGPLGMTGTGLDGSPAHGATGPLSDLAALGRELLAPTLLPADVMREATTVVFPGLSGILPGFGRQDPNDWGLGFEIRDGKKPHWTGTANSPATFGHFGRTGTFLWVDPDAELACACLTNREFGEWAVERWPELANQVLREFGRSGGGRE
jgi:CubicO group peptidase (beta-lactamase class C family)